MATTIDEPSRTWTIVLWVLRVLMAALFLYAAYAKLTSQPQMVEGFALLPVGQWFRYVVGLMELVGGVAVLIPAVSGLGALLLLVVDVGAFFAQILFMHEDWITPLSSGPFSLRSFTSSAAQFANGSDYSARVMRPALEQALRPLRSQ